MHAIECPSSCFLYYHHHLFLILCFSPVFKLLNFFLKLSNTSARTVAGLLVPVSIFCFCVDMTAEGEGTEGCIAQDVECLDAQAK